MAGCHDTARHPLWCRAHDPRSDCTLASAENAADLWLPTGRSVNLISLASGDPRLALLDCLFHDLDTVDRASFIAEKTEPTATFQPLTVSVPDWIARAAYSNCFRAAGTLQWRRHLRHTPS